MAIASTGSRRSIRKIHRISALLATFFIVVYTLSGLLLNHRKDLGYFQNIRVENRQVPRQDLTTLNRFIDSYKGLIGRPDAPKVIRIKEGGVVEFLYGSHGKTTYVIHPENGRMEIRHKEYLQPWRFINDLHKAWKTKGSWALLSDTLGLITLLAAISGLLIIRYRMADILLGTAGILLIILGAIGQW